MFRYVFELVSTLVVFGVARYVIASVTRSIGSMGPLSNQPNGYPDGARQPREMQTTGELRKDPVCGTFVATNTPYTRIVNGVATYFCSKECRDRYKSGPTPQRNNDSEWHKSTAARS